MKIDQPWKPVEGQIMTRWAKDVDPQLPLPEYPRPQMVRANWQNLNGLWEYAVQPMEDRYMGEPKGQILVPFPLEAALSGVKRVLQPDERLWYRRRFTLPEEWQHGKVLLHFGAVDWESRIWVNGEEAGHHTGGYDPFSLDISAFLHRQGENELVVSVWDPSDTGMQECGKQTLHPQTVFYTPTAGIWQTVWLEPVPETYIRGVKLTPDIDREMLVVGVDVVGQSDKLRVAIDVIDEGQIISTQTGKPGRLITLPIASPKLWGPDSPYLYDLRVRLLHENETLDHV
ncbi:MAG: hypothetical protein HGA53_10255, partial [Anaerolineaceae bacterium]|nr:hypothetical protein [Anaerolineaceae bacterium]